MLVNGSNNGQVNVNLLNAYYTEIERITGEESILCSNSIWTRHLSNKLSNDEHSLWGAYQLRKSELRPCKLQLLPVSLFNVSLCTVFSKSSYPFLMLDTFQGLNNQMLKYFRSIYRQHQLYYLPWWLLDCGQLRMKNRRHQLQRQASWFSFPAALCADSMVFLNRSGSDFAF